MVTRSRSVLLAVVALACAAPPAAANFVVTGADPTGDVTDGSPGRDITRVGPMNVLGMVSRESDDPELSGVPLHEVIVTAPTSLLAEQLRQVRTRLQHAISLETTRTLLVTSPGPGDGKTALAANLAAGLALNGRRILLVDANFHRPALAALFKVGNEQGFSNVLESAKNLERENW